MNLLELASMLGMDIRQAEKLAQRGEIPCQKVGGELRFNRAEITEWLQQRMGTLEKNNLKSMDEGITAHRQALPDEAIITPMLRPEAIATHLNARTKNSVLKELVALAMETGEVYDGEALLEALLQREELCSTAMEAGVAIPHPRRPLPYAIAEPLLIIANTPQGIGFGAPDGKLTDLFFLTCSMDDRHHLHVLARLCRMLHDGKLTQALREASTTEEYIDLIRERELKIMEESN
jgi:PTS system nitrogen regulatory IIA component